MKIGSTWSGWPAAVVKAVLVGLIHLYRYTLSPVLHMLAPGGGCRFLPTCSDYALQAVRLHGPWRGLWLALLRFARCHPWGGHGYDPVPHSCSCTARTDLQHPSPSPRPGRREDPSDR